MNCPLSESEDAYRIAHRAALLRGETGEVAHAVGVKAQLAKQEELKTAPVESKLDAICDLISEIEFGDTEAEKLIAMMSDYRKTYSRTYNSLMRVPGFRKLWDAIEEAAHFSCRKER